MPALRVQIPQVAGEDRLGRFNTTIYDYGNGNEVLMEASIRTYEDPAFVVFEQFFPREIGSELSAERDMRARTFFPAIRRASNPDLMALSYHGIFPSVRKTTLGGYRESAQGGTPLILVDARNSSLPMTVFSPLGTPKAHHMATDRTHVGAGVKATAKMIPAGTRQSFLLSAGEGVNSGMLAWGDRLLRYFNTRRADLYGDKVVSTIGFWTDNGGFYHYKTIPNENYEETVTDLKAYHDRERIPFGHWQFDSWFYPKDGVAIPLAGGGGGGVKNWTADSRVFPSGMAHIQSVLKVPLVMHNRQWSPKSDYVAAGTYPWLLSKHVAVPEDPEQFFRWFFTQQEGWGLSV